MAFIETTMINNKVLAVIFCIIYNIDYCQSFDYKSLFSKKYVDTDTVVIDTFSINPRTFQILNKDKKSISLDYKLLPYKGLVVFLEINSNFFITNLLIKPLKIRNNNKIKRPIII